MKNKPVFVRMGNCHCTLCLYINSSSEGASKSILGGQIGQD